MRRVTVEAYLAEAEDPEESNKLIGRAVRLYRHAMKDLGHARAVISHARDDCAHAIELFEHEIEDAEAEFEYWHEDDDDNDEEDGVARKSPENPKGLVEFERALADSRRAILDAATALDILAEVEDLLLDLILDAEDQKLEISLIEAKEFIAKRAKASPPGTA